MTSQAYNVFYYKFELQGCWCSCDCDCSPLILVEKSVVKLWASDVAILGDKRNNIYEEGN